MSRTYAGVPAEQRRAERRDALLDAALDLLHEDGPAAVTMRGVTTRARLNDRYFSEQFADRDALLLALLDGVAAEATARMLTALATTGDDGERTVRAVLLSALTYLGEDPRRGSVLVLTQATERTRARRTEIVRALAEIVVQHRERLLPGRRVTDAEAALNAFILVSGILDLPEVWVRGELDQEPGPLADFLTRVLLAGAGIAPPAADA